MAAVFIVSIEATTTLTHGAIDFYNNESDGLGSVFLQEVLNAIQHIANFPNAWHPLSENTTDSRVITGGVYRTLRY